MFVCFVSLKPVLDKKLISNIKPRSTHDADRKSKKCVYSEKPFLAKHLKETHSVIGCLMKVEMPVVANLGDQTSSL